MGLKIIVMGTGPFALPTFEWLVQSEHDVCLLVTRPIVDAGKRRKTAANPVRDFAESVPGLPIFAPANINDSESVQRLNECQADLLFVCDYGQILKNPCLASARLGGINLHGSLLPKYRGAAPINWAVYHGDSIMGVTVIHMTPKLDGGPELAKRSMQVEIQDTAETLEPRLAELGVEAVQASLAELQAWDGESPLGNPQDSTQVTKAPRLRKPQGNLDWNRSAVELLNQVRAFQPWPGSFTHWLPTEGTPLRLILHRVTVVEAAAEPAEAGTVMHADAEAIVVATGAGCLAIHELQPAGKRKMDCGEFLRGKKVAKGDRLGPLPSK